jgi:hypothetical protein
MRRGSSLQAAVHWLPILLASLRSACTPAQSTRTPPRPNQLSTIAATRLARSTARIATIKVARDFRKSNVMKYSHRLTDKVSAEPYQLAN